MKKKWNEIVKSWKRNEKNWNNRNEKNETIEKIIEKSANRKGK